MRRVLVASLVCVSVASTSAASQTGPACAGTPYDCAVAQVQRSEFAAAIPVLEKLTAASPRDLRALNLLGIALTGAGKPAEANDRFRAALAIDPGFTPALRNLAVNEFTLGRLSDAEQHLRAVLERSSDDEIAHAYLGEIAFARKRHDQALPHYDRSRARIAQNPRWTLHYATALLAGKRRADAAALVDRLPQQEPEVWFDAGVAFGQHAAYADAARFFATARRLGYKDAYAAGYNQALMLIEAAEYNDAIRLVDELVAAGSRRAELYSLVSRAYAKSDRVKDAYDALREATRLEPHAAEHYIDLAMLCLEHENYDLGLEIVDIGLKHRPDSAVLYLQRGVVLAMKGSVELAEQEFLRASQAAPQDPSPHVALAMVWMQQGQTPRAVAALRARAHASSTAQQAVIHYALGIALLRSGATPQDPQGLEALEAFRTAVRLQPAFGPAQAELGKLLLRRNDVAAAIAHLEKAVELEPESSAPAYVLSQAYRRDGQTDRARDMLARVSRLNAQERGDSDTDLRRAMFRIVRDGSRFAPTAAVASDVADGAGAAAACAAAGDFDGAVDTLRKNVDRGPATPELRYQLAVTLWNRYQRAARRQKTDLDDAIAALSRAVEEDGGQPHFHLVLGQLLAEQERFAPAVVHLERARALAPADTEYPYNLGLALRLQGNLDGAEAQFRSALAITPGHGLARRSLGLVLRQKGDLRAAARELDQAVALLPDDPQGRHLLGSVLLRLGETDRAVAALREAVRLDPSLVEAHVTLAQAFAKQGQDADAKREQTEVERINAVKAAFGRTLVLLDASHALLARGDIAGAIARRREAVAASPEFAEAHFELGLALQRGDATRQEAESSLRQAIALDPRLARAHAALATLLEGQGETAGASAARARAAELAPCSIPGARAAASGAVR
jgi:tetratricopeptide (TPR) repeat protein